MRCLLLSLSLLCICMVLLVVQAKNKESYSARQPTFLSVRHLTDGQPPLSICVPHEWMPCKQAIRAIVDMEGTVAMHPVVHIDSTIKGDLTCSDLVSLWMSGMGGMGDMIVAPCPGNDLELTIVACLGRNGLPQTPLTSAGLELRQVALAGDTIVCAGPLEQRLVNDLWASISGDTHTHTPIPILTSLTDPCTSAFQLDLYPGPPARPLARPSSSTSTQAVQLDLYPGLPARPLARPSSSTSTQAFMRPKGHPDVLTALARQNAVAVILPKLDASIFSILQPMAKLTGPAITSTCVFIGRPGLDLDPRVVEVVHTLTYVDPFWALSEMNYAAKVLDSVLPSTQALLHPMNLIALTRQEKGTLSTNFYGIPSIPVLMEGYVDNTNITLQAEVPVEAYMRSTTQDGRSRVLVVRHPYIGAARMRPGDRLQLRGQAVSKHNGDYIVTTTGIDGTVLVSWVEADYDALSFTDEVTPNTMTAHVKTIKHLWPQVLDIQVGDMLLLRNLNNPDGSKGVWTTVKTLDMSRGTLTIQIIDPNTGHTAASDGSCMTSPTTEIKSVCKAEGGLWDAPCTSDDQCPYFQKNLVYPNYRGGCLDSGWCEMPLGVTQPSFRTATGNAFSHNAKLLDIAFPLDQYERYVFGLT